MKRAAVVAAAALAAVGAFVADGAHSAGIVALPPPVARPNPATFGVRLEYVAPLPAATGGVAQLPPLEPAATAASFLDQQYLAYERRGDLGGFLAAPIGEHALSSGGRNVVGIAGRRPQLPLYAQAAGGGIRSYTFTGGGAVVTPPENGRSPVPGLGVPPTTPTPPGSSVPPPNQGFGGKAGGTTTTTTTTRTTPPPPPPTTTTRTTPPPPTTTTAPTTTAATTTAATTTTAPPPPPANTCGTAGIAITSNLTGCRIYAVNMAPGDSTSERLTITNTSGSPYTLSLQAAGTQNGLWQDLRMGVWEQGTAPPSPLPPLLDWTTQFNALTTLQPGQTETFVIELYLPTSAGNADQNLAAVIDFRWRANG